MDLSILTIYLLLGTGLGLSVCVAPLLALATLVLGIIADDPEGFLPDLLVFIGYGPLLASAFYLMIKIPMMGELSWWPLFVLPVGLLCSIIPARLLKAAVREKNRWKISEHICGLLAVICETIGIMLFCYCGRFF